MPSTTLHDALSVSLILRQVAPYLPISSLLALAATSKSFKHLVFSSQEATSYLDLSNIKSLTQVSSAPVDVGGISWRSQRMDESLTPDEFYTGPLRGIFSKLARRRLLQNVQTLVLDGLSVTAEIVRDIIAEDQYNSVRLLSIREVHDMNERKLMQVLRYAIRLTRPEGSPKIKGLYLFGPRDPAPSSSSVYSCPPERTPPEPPPSGVTSSVGAQIGSIWNRKSQNALASALTNTEEKWYQPTGRMCHSRLSQEWAETIADCKGVIAFDATVCRGPRHDTSTVRAPSAAEAFLPCSKAYLNATFATVALGPSGCASCGSSPEGSAIFGRSPVHYFPLLAPLPLHTVTIHAAQRPGTNDGCPPPPLYLRCVDCLRGRWCERCNRWWCEHCYSGPRSTNSTSFYTQEDTMGVPYQAPGLERKQQQTIKVHMNLCTEHCLVGEWMAGAGGSGMWG